MGLTMTGQEFQQFKVTVASTPVSTQIIMSQPEWKIK